MNEEGKAGEAEEEGKDRQGSPKAMTRDSLESFFPRCYCHFCCQNLTIVVKGGKRFSLGLALA